MCPCLIFHIIITQDDFQGDLCVWKGGRKMNFSCRDILIKINRLIKGGEVTALHLMHMTISGEGKNFENAVFKVYFWKFATLKYISCYFRWEVIKFLPLNKNSTRDRKIIKKPPLFCTKFMRFKHIWSILFSSGLACNPIFFRLWTRFLGGTRHPFCPRAEGAMARNEIKWP